MHVLEGGREGGRVGGRRVVRRRAGVDWHFLAVDGGWVDGWWWCVHVCVRKWCVCVCVRDS